MDHTIEIPAGGEFPMQVSGQFVYCKYATHPVRVLVNQEPVTMEPGDKWRVAGGFSEFLVANPHDQVVRCVFTVGEGDYNRQIVQGTITVNPGIRTESGEFVEDTRTDLRLNVLPSTGETGTFQKNEFVIKAAPLPDDEPPDESPGNTGAFTVLKDKRILFRDRLGLDKYYLFEWPPRYSGASLQREVYNRLGPEGESADSAPHAADGSVWFGSVVEHPDPNISTPIMAVYEYDDPSLGVKGLKYIYGAAVSPYPLQGDIKWVVKSGRTLFYRLVGRGNAPDGIHAVDIVNRVYLGYLDVRLSNVAWGAIYNGKLHLSTGLNEGPNENMVVDPTTWQELDFSTEWEMGQRISHMEGIARLNENSFVCAGTGGAGSGGARKFMELALKEMRVGAWGYASPCKGRLKLGKPNRTTANVEKVATDEGGRVKYAGELIKLALEYYSGQVMPPDYLDYVYRVEADNLNGLEQHAISGGGMSFAGADIQDMGTAWFPQTVTITVRKGLF